jgi:hypothetical protein
LADKKVDIGNKLTIFFKKLKWNFFLHNSAVADFTATLARSTVISFSTKITKVHNSMFIKNPAGAYNFKAYTETFNDILWVALAFFFITIPPVLFLIIRYMVLFKTYLFTIF